MSDDYVDAFAYGMRLYSSSFIPDQVIAQPKLIKAHPIICWLSQFLACFGIRLDPWVELPPQRKYERFAYLLNNRALFMSPQNMAMISGKFLP